VYVVIWEYAVSAGKAGEFARVYGRDGDWSAYFKAFPGYISTGIFHGNAGRYLVLDYWSDRASYRSFLDGNREDYERMSEGYKALYDGETRIGDFVVADFVFPPFADPAFGGFRELG
jgi:heme-degrading monooxygenase HmoA